MTTTIEILNEWITRKIAYGSRNFNLDEELKELFGPPEEIIAEFESKIGKVSSNELIDILVQAGAYKLNFEYYKAYGKFQVEGSNFSSIVENMCFGDGSLSKNAQERRTFYSEKMFIIGQAQNQIEEFAHELRDHLNEL